MPSSQVILFFLFGLVAEVAGTIAGFGSSTVYLPAALFFFDFKTALILVAFSHFFGNLGRVGWFKHGLDYRLLVLFGLPSVLCSVAGAFLIAYTSPEHLKAVVGGFLVVYALLAFWKEQIRLKPTGVNAVVGGSLSGFLAGLIGTGGALRGAFLSAVGLTKERYIATAAAIALAVDISRIPVYLQRGYLPESFYWYIPVLLVVALVGSFVGKKIVEKISATLFRKIILAALLIIGVYFILDFFV